MLFIAGTLSDATGATPSSTSKKVEHSFSSFQQLSNIFLFEYSTFFLINKENKIFGTICDKKIHTQCIHTYKIYSVSSIVLYVYFCIIIDNNNDIGYTKRKEKDDIRNYTQGWIIERERNYYWKIFWSDKIYTMI